MGRPRVVMGVGEAPTPLRLLSVTADASGVIRLHYEVLATDPLLITS